MKEKERIVSSDDYGKDEVEAKVRQKLNNYSHRSNFPHSNLTMLPAN